MEPGDEPWERERIATMLRQARREAHEQAAKVIEGLPFAASIEERATAIRRLSSEGE